MVLSRAPGRAVQTADQQVYRRWAKARGALKTQQSVDAHEDAHNMTDTELSELQANQKLHRQKQDRADRSRPLVGVGQTIRIRRSKITTPAYGRGNIVEGALARVTHVQHIHVPSKKREEWHYCVELLESPYIHATTPARVWLTEEELDSTMSRRRG